MVIGIDGSEANIENRVGVNQYAAELLAALEKLQDARDDFIIYLSAKPLPHLPKARNGWEYKVLSGGGMWVLRKLMPHLWLGSRPDILFTPSHYLPPFSPVPMVMSVMDLGYLRFPGQFEKYDFYQLKYWGQLSMWQAKKIIAISQATRQDLASHYPWTRRKVEVTPLGYDKGRYNAKTKNQKAKIGQVKRKYKIAGEYILCLGTLKPSKNIEGLLEAFQLLVTSHKLPVANLQLVIAGKKGWLYDSIFRKVQELKLADKVVFTDFVPEDDKPALYAAARALVSPSFWEGFGMHVLEAMAVGCPVVVSNVGSLPEVVGNAAVIIDPYSPESIAQGIAKAIQNYDLLSLEGLAQARKFDWAGTAQQTLRILQEAASKT